MFGYVAPHGDMLSKGEKARYQALYCGLCAQLGDDHGSFARLTLTYDMTFLAALLSSLYGMEEAEAHRRCPAHPLRKRWRVQSAATAYASDMNMLLSYEKCRDDWQDDASPLALGKAAWLKARAKSIPAKWPRQAKAIETGLADLAKMEHDNLLDPDPPANCFGALLGEIFVLEEDEWADALRAMGAALGRFLYILDASIDLPRDIRRQRYNPLTGHVGLDIAPILTALIGECTATFETLPLKRDQAILRNILYAGIWQRSHINRERQGMRHE